MFYLVGVQEMIQTLTVLSSKDSSNLPKDFKELEVNFHKFLNQYQPKVVRSDRLGVNIVDDKDWESSLTNLFATDSFLNDKNQSCVIGEGLNDNDREVRVKKLQSALDELSNINAELYFMLQLVVDSIFLRYAKDSGGGSTSNAIGVIWINNRDFWSMTDLMELLVHELTHNTLFIDELRFLHFYDYHELLKPENFAQSAILHTKRPLDKVLHSIVVASEVLQFRKNCLGEPKNPMVHPDSNTMIKQALDAYQSITSMSNYQELVTDRGRWILDKSQEMINELIEK